jgi:hypothetical protein
LEDKDHVFGDEMMGDAMEDYKIDFVIPWVDGNDYEWIRQKEKYWVAEGNTPFLDGNQAVRFRDWDNLKYWFRGVEKFTPWVNRIYFVTWGHVPEWLNTNHPKLTIVNHKDYIPNQYLPVFQANPIELNFHRIPGLEEHFVYFNDDMFVIDKMEKEDFFLKGLPREMAAMYLLSNNGDEDTFQYMLFRMMGEVNSHFDLHSCIKRNWKKWFNLKYKKHLLNNFLLYRFYNVSGLLTPHVPSSLRKSVMEEVWNMIPDAMMETCGHRFRNPRDITQYIFRYWTIMKGEFEPTNIYDYSREFFVTDQNNQELIDTIKNQKSKMICVNDSIALNDFEQVKTDINTGFEFILNEKSSFER